MIEPELSRPAIFLDRDGTLIKEVNYLSRVEDLEILPNTKKALEMFHSSGFLKIVVTNQSGVGRGLFTAEDVVRINSAMASDLDGLIDSVYFCPHSPDDDCKCRKPAAGLIEAAQAEMSIDLSRSWVIGDKAIDVELGSRLGMKTALVLTGYGRAERKAAEDSATIVADDLLDAARRIAAIRSR